MKIRVRKVTVEKWPDGWRDRIILALWIVLLRVRYSGWFKEGK